MTSGEKGILIIDHDPILCEFLQKYLSQNSYETHVLIDSNHIPTILANHTIAAIIIEQSLLASKVNRFFWLEWLKEYYPPVKILVFSMNCGKANRLLYLEEGIEDFICKPFYNKEILIRLNNSLDIKKQPSTKKNIVIGNKILNIKDQVVIDKNNKLIKLTDKEFNILMLLAKNVNKIISRPEIKYHVDGAEFNPVDRSIDIHINKLRQKIEADVSNPAYIKTIRGKGYQLMQGETAPHLMKLCS